MERSMVALFERDKPWFDERLRAVEERVRGRLDELSAYLDDADWLEGAFSAADILMVHVLPRSRSPTLLDAFPRIAGCAARGEARPAYQRAFAARRAVFEAGAG